MQVDPSALAEMRGLYERGLCLQVYGLAQQFGPLQEWRGAEAQALAGRLAANLGAPRLQQWLHLKAWRSDRNHAEARYYLIRTALERRGPLGAWKLLKRFGDLSGAPPQLRSDWLAFAGYVAGRLRDFDTAEYWHGQALSLCPDNPWIYVERASLLEAQDRYDEALASARRALELRPWYRPGVQSLAHLLQLLERDQEALELLTEAAQRVESGPLVAQLVLLQSELHLYPEAWETLDRFVELCPLMEKEFQQWLGSRRSELAYLLGDHETAIREAQALAEASPFHQEVAERMAAAGPDARRVLHPVGFVRQHHMTCAPATLSALSRFWGRKADHLALVEEICYDGTPAHSERSWAETNGWIAREFRVTWESATALLDRGLPFTLTTVQTANAHLQACVGYDARRGSFLIRDPYLREVGEFLVDHLLEQHRSSGPRGMTLVPAEQAHLLEGIQLPDAEHYDQFHRLQAALQQHDRGTAHAACEALRALDPEHLLTLQAERSLAAYDANSVELLACIEKLVARYPEDQNFQLCRLSLLREHATREERLQALKEICDREETDPLFWQQYAQELGMDARRQEESIRLLRRTLRCRPLDAPVYFILANTLWDQRKWDEALVLYRFAACLDDKDEQFSRGYFNAARHLNRVQHALQFLEGRYRRFGARSGHPARTLFWALSELDQTPRAFKVLEEALRARPTDDELTLFAVEAYGRHGRYDRAQQLLSAAHGNTSEMAWLRSAGSLALLKGDTPVALSLWRQVLERDPLAIEAHRNVARLLAQMEGPEAAKAHYAAATQRFPHNYLLFQAWEEWLRDDDPAGAEAVLRQVLRINPADAWSHRELALSLAEQRRFDEAMAAAKDAYQLAPSEPACYTVLGEICLKQGQAERARSAYREAIRLSVDNGYAIARLIECCDTPAEQRAELQFVEGELTRQALFGEGLVAYRHVARDVLTPEELLASVWRALQTRPDVWHTWTTAVRQLNDMSRYDQAIQLAHQATQRFPMVPNVWLELALVYSARLDRENERKALQQALLLRPGWGSAVRQLCQSYERAGEFRESEALLEATLNRDPLDALSHGWYADVLWKTGRKEEAIARVKHALTLDPDYGWAWNSLREWTGELRRPEEAAELARDLTRRRPGTPESWMMLARVLTGERDAEERLAAYNQAIALNLRYYDAYDERAECLAEMDRLDEAVACCYPPGIAHPPLELRARAAWLEAVRGNVETAIQQMRAIVQESPNYVWGWAQLARWHDAAGRNEEYAQAAAELVRINPQDTVGHLMLGEARMQAGDRYGAKAAYHHALSLQPDNEYAGLSLFMMQLEDNELLAAAHTLQTLRQRTNSEWIIFRGVELAARQNDAGAALERFRELCFYPLEEEGLLPAAAEMLKEAQWGDWVDQTYQWALSQPGLHPRVGELWVEASIARGDWSCEQHLPSLVALGAVGACAYGAFVEALADQKSFDRARQFIHLHREILRSHNRSWAKVAYAYSEMEDYPAVVNWMADWQQREAVRPWMVVNLVLALRSLARDKDAAFVSRKILETDEASTAAQIQSLWLALDAGFESRADELTTELAKVDPDNLPPYYAFLYLITRAMREVQGAGPAEKSSAFGEAKRLIDLARNAYPPFKSDILLKRYFPLAVKRVAAEAGGFGATAWQASQLIR